MSIQQSTSWHSRTTLPQQDGKSILRAFLEDEDSFRWPADDDHCKDSYFNFNETFPINSVFICERNLSLARCRKNHEGTQRVLQYRIVKDMQERMRFRKSVAIKELTRSQSPDDANYEANAMKGLRHPHISAFLGLFYDASWRKVNHIVTFPVGCCDLGDLMACISMKLEKEKIPELKFQQTDSQEDIAIRKEYSWPFEEELEQQLRRLEGYFLCLCEALAYLHESNIRHRDIKPENIIIDYSGMVVVIDFGTAKKFKKGQSMHTHDVNTLTSPVYRPPEHAKKEAREPRSDVFSLGCVFLEMMSLLFRRSLDQLKQRTCKYLPKMKQYVEGHHLNLDRIYAWLEELRSSDTYYRPAKLEAVQNALDRIIQMLAVEPENRPEAKGLWQSFDLADEKCRDCHPKAVGIRWEPTELQRHQHEKSQAARMNITSMQDQETEAGLLSEIMPDACSPQEVERPTSPRITIDAAISRSGNGRPDPMRKSSRLQTRRVSQSLNKVVEEDVSATASATSRRSSTPSSRSSSRSSLPPDFNGAQAIDRQQEIEHDGPESTDTIWPREIKQSHVNSRPPSGLELVSSWQSDASVPQPAFTSCTDFAHLPNPSSPCTSGQIAIRGTPLTSPEALPKTFPQADATREASANISIKKPLLDPNGHGSKPKHSRTRSNAPYKSREINATSNVGGARLPKRFYTYSMRGPVADRVVEESQRSVIRGRDNCQVFVLPEAYEKYGIYGSGTSLGEFEVPSSLLSMDNVKTVFAKGVKLIGWKLETTSAPRYICLYNWEADSPTPEHLRPQGSGTLERINPVPIWRIGTGGSEHHAI